MSHTPAILYTHTDEAPALATYSLLPIIRAFTASAGIRVETRDISLAGRILAAFADLLPAGQRQSDDLAELGRLATTPEANIIKLPNISASLPQMTATIKELQAKGYAVPDYPETPTTPEQKDHKARYDRVKGSAVNPVLREGNSDRRAPGAVKAYARKNPHSMGAWRKDSPSHVAHMQALDFFGSEISLTLAQADSFRIEFVSAAGDISELRKAAPLQAGEVIDACVMSASALRAFLAEEMAAAKQQGLLLSVHLKATMMKVSDPILFGHAVSVYLDDVFSKHADTLRQAGVNPNNGLGEMYAIIETLPSVRRWPWSIPTRASPICTYRVTSSSTPRCQPPSVPPGRCMAPMANCTTQRH